MNPYKVLGVRPSASLEEIKSAYENLSSTYSVDNFESSPEQPFFEDKLSELNEAYNSLINDIKYKDIRKLIENEQFLSAETELNLIGDKTSPEWNYLKGFVMLKKGWVQAGVNHLKTAAELNPTNEEYKETLLLLNKKINQRKANYARMARARAAASSNNNNSMCGGGGQSNNMCGGPSQGGGGGIDPNLLSMLMGNNANPMGNANATANPMGNTTNPMGNAGNTGANPMGNMNPLGGGANNNPLQNMLMQSLMSGGGNGMNMCGGAPGGKGMC